MDTYELTFLVKDEAENKNIKSTIESFKGNVTKETPWGERALAYPINKEWAGKFFTWEFKMDKGNLAELKKKLTYNEQLMRHLILKID